MNYTLRIAQEQDISVLKKIISESTRELSKRHYSEEQIELALESALGVDTQLIKDKTYFCIEDQDEIIACGGWSYRTTLFGNDNEKSRNATQLDPGSQAAKVRAFFVKPQYARQGLGSMLMKKCESEAIKLGYSKLELMATLPGVKLYEKHGFSGRGSVEYQLSDEVTITFVPMYKQI
ncbi:GNAT family N-acetyltransferase [Pseudoalteromonas luteoviolacea]|uniref:GNAT family N-acetyltransferase n=1 Tax=Pseudoalteromonas luteoviolacea TaxID=43657 RepID=UPI001B3587D5|nr:GNAT family N-acetyltransferase [Pseudoalteromonas luteoviolacea]MBQ4810008.1 GNAT family N-acetyltransferase [Pseudoalteromonas luteoviolacea]